MVTQNHLLSGSYVGYPAESLVSSWSLEICGLLDA